MRISRNELFMSLAVMTASRGTCRRRQVGAVIVFGDRVVSTGYNGSARGLPHCQDAGCDLSKSCEVAVHAEINAMVNLDFKATQDEKMLYVTTAPCFNCADMIIQAGFRRVFYLEGYRNSKGLAKLDRANISTICLKEYDEFYPRIKQLIDLYDINIDGTKC